MLADCGTGYGVTMDAAAQSKNRTIYLYKVLYELHPLRHCLTTIKRARAFSDIDAVSFHVMPFFGSDWRAPGDKWIRTEVGWKRLADIHANFQLQLSKVAASVMPSSAKRSSARLRSHSGSPRNSTRNSSRASSRASSPPREKHYERWVPLLKKSWYIFLFTANHNVRKSLDERRLHFLQLALGQFNMNAPVHMYECNVSAV